MNRAGRTVKLRGKKVIGLQGTRSTLRGQAHRGPHQGSFPSDAQVINPGRSDPKYLGHLTSHARSSLLVEIERMQMYDEDISGFEIVLAELRAEFRKSGETHNRIGNPSRYFFKPIEALFVDRSPERANSGQISRGSLSAIWEWINQDLLPSMARDYCEQMKQLIVKDDRARRADRRRIPVQDSQDDRGASRLRAGRCRRTKLLASIPAPVPALTI